MKIQKKKILATAISLTLIVFLSNLAIVSACGCPENSTNEACCSKTGMTLIEGKIYEGESSNGIEGAGITVTCYHGGSEYTKNSESWFGGKYMVFFLESQCDYGDSVTVSAEKGGMTGTNNGTVDTIVGSPCFTLDVGIVNVPLIPEFGAVIGTLTAVSAVGIFFFVKKIS